MKPSKSILSESFNYVPSSGTSVDATWRRFGWQPITDKDRRIRRVVPGSGSTKPILGSKSYSGS
jgi:hypothetical protein